MKEFTEEYLSNLKRLIDNKNEELVRAQIRDLHPADLAELVGDLDDEEAVQMMAEEGIEITDGDESEDLDESPAEDEELEDGTVDFGGEEF